jgi:hypothetical protein
MIINYNLFSQNLVNNPGFDVKYNCPSYQVFKLQQNVYNWKGSVGTGYNNKCNINQNEPYWLTNSIPYNGAGFQDSFSDSGYVTINAFINFSSDTRGVIFQKLKTNLDINKKYFIEYYASLSDSSNYGVKKLGVSFQVDSNFNTEIEGYPRIFKLINEKDYIIDKLRWTNLNWIYTPDSNYISMIIGYFNDISTLNEIDTIYVGSNCNWCSWFNPNTFSYYYIENVGVYPIISNNQTLQPCTFPQVLQGPVGNDIWFREWKKDTTVLSANINQTINQAGTYTLTWRTDTTVHIDTFWVEAYVPISNFLGQDIAWQSGNSITLSAPDGYSYLWNTGSNTQNIVVDTTGIFSVVVTNTFDCAYTDSVVVFNPLGVKEVLEKLEVEIYPNPAKENINIKSTEPNCNIEIYASDGKMVLHQKLVNSLTINVAEWQQGIYYVKFYSEHGTKIPVVRKVVVQK